MRPSSAGTSMADFRIGVVGCAGRMGQMLVREIAGTKGTSLSGGTEGPGNPMLGRDAGEVAGLGALQAKIGSDAKALFASSDAVIDFTAPAATVAHARLAAESGKILVIGTTGLSAADEAAIAEAAKKAVIVRSP